MGRFVMEGAVHIKSLGYVGMEANEPEAWRRYATDVLGAPVITNGGEGIQYVRFDHHHHRLAIHPGQDGRLAYIGWELQTARDLELAAEELDRSGVAYERGSAAACALRHVDALIHCKDPEGNRVELFHGPHTFVEPLRPTRDISGFVALGHAFCGVGELAPVETFYTDILGFRVSDYIDFSVATCGSRPSSSIATTDGTIALRLATSGMPPPFDDRGGRGRRCRANL